MTATLARQPQLELVLAVAGAREAKFSQKGQPGWGPCADPCTWDPWWGEATGRCIPAEQGPAANKPALPVPPEDVTLSHHWEQLQESPPVPVL